jgi:uncharacterized membrane protein YebE (DUF533 family)
MRRSDTERLLGALLGGAATPPRRRRRTTPAAASPLGSRRTASAIGALASIAATVLGGVLSGGSQPAPARGRVPDTHGAPWSGSPPPRAPQPVGTGWSPPPPPADAEDTEGLLLVRAAIAAAKADGTLDAAEREHITRQLDECGLTPAERDFVLGDLQRPLSPEDLARQVRDPMLAAQVYAAAAAAAGEVTPAERTWLDTLARALRLDRAAAQAIEARLA